MRTSIYFLLSVLAITLSYGQTSDHIKFVDATELTMIGKAMPTSHPYHRVDTDLYNELTVSEKQQARSPAGLAIVFKTNSSFIQLYPTYTAEHKRDNMTGFSVAGFDLYIKSDGEWIYADSGVSYEREKPFNIINHMDNSEKECLLYLPIYSEIESLKVGVESSATISAIPNPFKSKIVFFGSSFTQGVSVSRSGMSYPLQIGRMLNAHVCNLGFSGNSKLQPYFAKALSNIQADAFVFDAFSNPSGELIRERLEDFVQVVASKHKDIPLIFVETIYRGRNNFDLRSRGFEKEKMEATREMMTEVLKEYPNVYFIDSPLPKDKLGDTSADGVHPSDLGYFYWAEYLAEKISEILEMNENQ